MESRISSYSSTEANSVFSTADEMSTSSSDDSFLSSDLRNISVAQESVFSPLAPPFQSQMGNEYLLKPETHPSDTGSLNTEFGDAIFANRLGNRSFPYVDVTEQNAQNYFQNAVPPSRNSWTGAPDGLKTRNAEMTDTYDFLMKSLSSANNYVSTLTREQLAVLRSIPPILLYEFLLQIANACTRKRSRRPLSNECAFCKNNGENEESYSSHSLKDCRGRVLCPVLRAFRCPRCGATGDRAHTIKYCPEPAENGLERTAGFLTRRRTASSTSLFSNNAWCLPSSDNLPPQVTSPSSATLNNSIWSNTA